MSLQQGRSEVRLKTIGGGGGRAVPRNSVQRKRGSVQGNGGFGATGARFCATQERFGAIGELAQSAKCRGLWFWLKGRRRSRWWRDAGSRTVSEIGTVTFSAPIHFSSPKSFICDTSFLLNLGFL